MNLDEIEVGGVYLDRDTVPNLVIRQADASTFECLTVENGTPYFSLMAASHFTERLPIPALDFSVLGQRDKAGRIAVFRYAYGPDEDAIAYFYQDEVDWMSQNLWRPAPDTGETLTYNGKTIRVTPALRAMLEKGEEA